MTIRFAGARVKGRSPVSAWRCHSAPMCAANDNNASHLTDETLIAALRHFARHGLAAAEHAGARAVSANRQSDRGECLHWLAVCRKLDQRLAERLCAKLGASAA
jgi:hypothetical protein